MSCAEFKTSALSRTRTALKEHILWPSKQCHHKNPFLLWLINSQLLRNFIIIKDIRLLRYGNKSSFDAYYDSHFQCLPGPSVAMWGTGAGILFGPRLVEGRWLLVGPRLVVRFEHIFYLLRVKWIPVCCHGQKVLSSIFPDFVVEIHDTFQNPIVRSNEVGLQN